MRGHAPCVIIRSQAAAKLGSKAMLRSGMQIGAYVSERYSGRNPVDFGS